MREPLLAIVGNGRGTGRDLQDSSTPAATRHISMPSGTEETCQYCPHAARVPVCGDNHLLGPSCPPSEQRAGVCATVLAHCSRHCRTGDVHCPPFTLAAGCCCDSLVVLPRLSCPRGEATAAIKHKRGPPEHTQGQAAGSTGHFTPPTPSSDLRRHRRGSWDRPLFIITQSWSVISSRLLYF